jgi:glycerol-3-phosphate dehydrogenase (NAD(P)+)
MDNYNAASIGVVGAGAWGTALAMTATRNGRSVTLWGRNHQDLMDIAARGENKRYLPGIKLTPMPHVTGDLSEALRTDVILLVLPTQQLRDVAPLMALNIRANQPVIVCAKGIERGTGKTVTEVLREFMPQAQLAVLSGPTFADEVVRGLPTAVTLAAADLNCATRLAATLSGRSFRCYATADLLGVELCGAIKNVLAIACGIAVGRGLGENARAALITRGLAELTRLALALGARPETLVGLSGLGDITLSCTSPQSRNYAFGLKLGQGMALAELEQNPGKLAEGRFTADAVLQRAAALKLELPICQAVHDILNEHTDIDRTIIALLSRPLKTEGV